MNKSVITFCTSVVAIILINCTKEEIVPGSDLPAEVRSYIEIHFPEHFITEAINNKSDSVNTYEITLDNLTNLEFKL